MILYGSTLSPFVRKAYVFALEKGLSITLSRGGFGEGGDAFAKASPFMKIPALCDGDFTLSDSSAIAAYFEALVPDPVLIPTAPQARGQTIWLDEFADTILGAAVGKIFFNRLVAPRFMDKAGDLAAADQGETVELPRALDYLETIVPTSLYLVGDCLSLADIAVASPIVNLAHLGIAVDSGRWPRTAAFIEKIHARPAFAGTITHERALLGLV